MCAGGIAARTHLMARLGEALRLRHRVTLVSAKAGAGKTTLVSEWLHEQERPAHWLSLDSNDNDPRRFFSYLVAALHQFGIKIESSRLETPQLPQAEALVSDLINDVAASSQPFLLLFDDYHLCPGLPDGKSTGPAGTRHPRFSDRDLPSVAHVFGSV